MAVPLGVEAPATTRDVRARSVTGGPRRVPAWLPRRGHVISGTTAGALAAAFHGTHYPGLLALSLGLWAVAGVVLTLPRSLTSHQRARHSVRVALTTFALVAALAATNLVPAAVLPCTLLTLAVAATTAASWSAVRQLGQRPLRALLVGDDEAVRTQVGAWARHPRVQIVGTYDLPEPTGSSSTSVAATAETLGAEAVIVAPGPRCTPADLQRLTWELERTRTPILLGGIVDRVAPHRLSASMYAGIPVIAVNPGRGSRLASTAKAGIDRVAGAALLAVVSPLLLLVALAVRLDSPGPAFFRQQRVGMGGRPFVMYKLRTMQVAAPVPQQLPRTAGNEVLFKMREDPRVTRVGRWLRRSSLDELPQLINVVRGEMSLVGPRPALFAETTKYDDLAWRRTAVKPGITGLWQVSGRSDLSWEESIALDTHYVDNWRLCDDFGIAIRTFRAVFGKKGAY